MEIIIWLGIAFLMGLSLPVCLVRVKVKSSGPGSCDGYFADFLLICFFASILLLALWGLQL